MFFHATHRPKSTRPRLGLSYPQKFRDQIVELARNGHTPLELADELEVAQVAKDQVIGGHVFPNGCSADSIEQGQGDCIFRMIWCCAVMGGLLATVMLTRRGRGEASQASQRVPFKACYSCLLSLHIQSEPWPSLRAWLSGGSSGATVFKTCLLQDGDEGGTTCVRRGCALCTGYAAIRVAHSGHVDRLVDQMIKRFNRWRFSG